MTTNGAAPAKLDDMVDMALSDIIKVMPDIKIRKGKNKAEDRKGPKAQGGFPAKKPGQNAQKSANKAKKNREATFNKGRGIVPMDVVGGSGAQQGAGKKSRRKNRGNQGNPTNNANKNTKPQQQQGKKGEIKVNISKPGAGGKGQQRGGGNKQVTGSLKLPDNFKLPPGTTLKISIQTGNKATATTIRTPENGGQAGGKKKVTPRGAGNQTRGQGQGQGQTQGRRTVIRVNPKAKNPQGAIGQGQQARRIVLVNRGQQKRENMFNKGRGITTQSGGNSNSNKPQGVRLGGVQKRNPARNQGRKIVMRRKN